MRSYREERERKTRLLVDGDVGSDFICGVLLLETVGDRWL